MADFFSSIYAFLFKYPPEVFRQGTFSFTGFPALTLVILAVAVVAVPVVGSYRKAGGRARGKDRALLAGVRISAVALVAFCRAQPSLELSSAVPQRNFVGVLVNDSRSMPISDMNGKPRADVVRSLIASDS